MLRYLTALRKGYAARFLFILFSGRNRQWKKFNRAALSENIWNISFCMSLYNKIGLVKYLYWNSPGNRIKLRSKQTKKNILFNVWKTKLKILLLNRIAICVSFNGKIRLDCPNSALSVGHEYHETKSLCEKRFDSTAPKLSRGLKVIFRGLLAFRGIYVCRLQLWP